MIRRAAIAGLAVASVGAAAALPATAAVTPVVTCIAPQDDGTGFRAYYGFSNDGAGATIPAGTARNRFTSGAADRGQGSSFPANTATPGFGDDRTHLRVAVDYGGITGDGPAWRLGLTTGTTVLATPTAASPRCDFDLTGRLTPDRSEARPGQDITWDLAVANDGGTPFPVGQISLGSQGFTEILPAAVAPDELMPGETIVYPARTRVTPDQCYGTAVASLDLSLNRGGIVRTRESDLSNNTLRAEIPVVCLTDVQVFTEAEAASYAPGATAGFAVTVINGGESAVPTAALRVRHSLAASLTPVGPVPEVLQPGERMRLRGTASTAGAACGALAHSATVALEDPTGRLVDGIANNNAWGASVAIAGGSCGPATRIARTPAPRFEVAVLGPRTGRIGRWATYTVRVRNRGTRTAQGLVVSFGLPKGSVLAQRLARRDVRTGNLVHRRTSTLKVGGTFTSRFRVRFSTARGRTRVFTARAGATNAVARSARRVVTVRPAGR